MTKKDKKQKKEKRESKERKKQLSVLSQRKESYKRIINIAGAETYYKNLPHALLKSIYDIVYPNIEIIVENTTNFNNDILNNIKNEINSRLYTTEIQICDNKLNTSDICILYTLRQMFSVLYAKLNKSLKRMDTHDSIKQQLGMQNLSKEPYQIIILNNIKNILDCVVNFLKEHDNKFSEKILSIVYEEVTKYFNYGNNVCPNVSLITDRSGRIKPHIKIKTFQSEVSSIKIDNNSRKIYRCYALIHSQQYPDGIIPITLKENTNIINNQKPIDVYIQDHALHRIKERLAINPIGYVYDCIGRSMLYPVVVCTDGQSYMIEYRYLSHKVGYLILTIENDIALIRSFKFITMTGTPEFNALKRKLGGSREDFEYLGIDTLNTILNSDIQKDPRLRKIFEQCGLGHLFGLVDLDNAQEIASEIKKYFKLK